MMTKEQYYLAVLAEECGELVQRAIKAARFGQDEVQVGQDRTNRERLIQEFGDLIAMGELLGITWIDVRPHVRRKKERVAHWMEHSRACGKLEPEPPMRTNLDPSETDPY